MPRSKINANSAKKPGPTLAEWVREATNVTLELGGETPIDMDAARFAHEAKESPGAWAVRAHQAASVVKARSAVRDSVQDAPVVKLTAAEVESTLLEFTAAFHGGMIDHKPVRSVDEIVYALQERVEAWVEAIED